MHVVIDHRLCDGCGLCAEYAPSAFRRLPDGLAYPVGAGAVTAGPPLAALRTALAPELREAVLEAIEICPEDCIAVDDGTDEVELRDLPLDDARAMDLVAMVRAHFPGTSFRDIVRVSVTDDDVRLWTAAGSFHRVPLGS